MSVAYSAFLVCRRCVLSFERWLVSASMVPGLAEYSASVFGCVRM